MSQRIALKIKPGTPMKKITLAIGGALMAIAAQSALAQNSVTLYGIVDTSVRYLTNANATNDSQVSMGIGPITGSRWGLKGSEDLGGGLSTVFRLEDGFNLWNGQFASANTLFNRMAYVGLSSNQYGTLTFGRQNTPLFDQLGNVYDPLTVGNYDQDGWLARRARLWLALEQLGQVQRPVRRPERGSHVQLRQRGGQHRREQHVRLDGVLHVRGLSLRCRLPAEQRRATTTSSRSST